MERNVSPDTCAAGVVKLAQQVDRSCHYNTVEKREKRKEKREKRKEKRDKRKETREKEMKNENEKENEEEEEEEK